MSGMLGSGSGSQTRYSGELHNLKVTQSVFNTPLTIIIGTRRVAAKLLFYGGFYSEEVSSGGGKGVGGGKGATTYKYYADVVAALCSGAYSDTPAGIMNVWDSSGKLENEYGAYTATLSSTVYTSWIVKIPTRCIRIWYLNI